MVLQGKDILAGAQTGTGKTAGFTLPLLELLQEHAQGKGHRPVRALVLTPTRELAAQVGESVETYGRRLPLRSTVVFGGVKSTRKSRSCATEWTSWWPPRPTARSCPAKDGRPVPRGDPGTG